VANHDRSWALGLTDEAFFHAFKKKFPFCDSMPTQAGYTARLRAEVSKGIEAMPEGGSVNDAPKTTDTELAESEDEVEKEAEPEKKAVWACPKCGRDDFKKQIGLTGHLRHCKGTGL